MNADGQAGWGGATSRHRASAQQLAYDYIRTEILSGRFSGGMKIDVNAVASALDISRMPVREALRQLDAEGLVTIRPNRGATVTALTARDVQELFEIRAVLEGLAARTAVVRFDRDAIEELTLLKDRMDRAQGDTKKWLERHNQFHDYIMTASGRPRLLRDIERVRSAVQPYLLMYINIYGDKEMTGYEHATLLEALKVGQPEAVEACVRDHIMSAAEGIIQFVENEGDGLKGKRSLKSKKSEEQAIL